MALSLKVPEGVTLVQHLEDILQTEGARLVRSNRVGDTVTAERTAGKILAYTCALQKLRKDALTL